jgi:4-oxalocrotonate tautomerase family enzyme
MPFINIKVLKGALSAEKKSEMITRVTEVVAEIEARPSPKDALQRNTWCIIEEVDFGSWGIGGTAITEEMFKASMERKK